MICETCLRLWIEYGEATTKMRVVTRNQSLRLEATRAGKAVSEAIRIHDVMAHPETHGATCLRSESREKMAVWTRRPSKRVRIVGITAKAETHKLPG